MHLLEQIIKYINLQYATKLSQCLKMIDVNYQRSQNIIQIGTQTFQCLAKNIES